MNRYVLGFAFDLNDRVLLITKNRPEWQDGLMNGLGGHIEEGEDPHHTMQREGSEETCGKLAHVDWKPYGRLKGQGLGRRPLGRRPFEMWLFCAQVPWAGIMGLDGVSTEEGRCTFVSLEDLPKCPTVPNLQYLISMAKTSLAGRDRCRFYEIQESEVPEVICE